MSPTSEAQRKATDKYIKNTFDEIKVRVSKGKKQFIEEHAKKNDDSINGFITKAIDEKIERGVNK
jgi:predicted HicB family RNase H-like nuclease